MRESPGDDDRVDEDVDEDVDDIEQADEERDEHPGASRTDLASPAEFIDVPANEPGDDEPPSS